MNYSIPQHLITSFILLGRACRVTAEDVAQLRTLMMGCVSVVREQTLTSASQSRSLASSLDKALHHMTQLTKQ